MPNKFLNPFRPGAGHMPPFLAGRSKEIQEFKHLLEQEVILDNLVLTGLRGTGKTVLLDTLKPIAIEKKWLWVGTDLSESSSISEERIALRLITDLALVTSSMPVKVEKFRTIGFHSQQRRIVRTLNFELMTQLFKQSPGLVSDRLKTVLEFVWKVAKELGVRGIIFAYDEAQNLSDHAKDKEFPLSLLLDVFQSIQKKEIPFMLLLAGLPTLFPKLIEARTFAERMFRIIILERLSENDSKDAIEKPIRSQQCLVKFSNESVKLIIKESAGYPYFIQFICRETYDAFLQKTGPGEVARIPVPDITRKLDSDFFAGRWARATDRQRELMIAIARLENCDHEFTVQEIAENSRTLAQKPFNPSHISQMLAALSEAGLIYKNRHGRYSFAVPLLGRFILRQNP